MCIRDRYRRDRGMTLDEAIEVGALNRVRPVVMTALATVLAMTPMALGVTGHAGFISQPLAVAVVGGLVSSTLLTLVLVPVLYRLTEVRGERRLQEERRVAAEREAQRVAAERAAEQARRAEERWACLLYTSPSPRDQRGSRMPSSA